MASIEHLARRQHNGRSQSPPAAAHLRTARESHQAPARAERGRPGAAVIAARYRRPSYALPGGPVALTVTSRVPGWTTRVKPLLVPIPPLPRGTVAPP